MNKKTNKQVNLKQVLVFVISLHILLMPIAFAGKDPEAGKMLSLDKQAKLEALKEMEAMEIMWDGLMPEGYIPNPQLFLFNIGPDQTAMDDLLSSTPVVETLNGQQISIPGFVVPLDSDDEMITEFLLVPYFGACIHVPPPPSNQMIHVVPKYPLLQDESWDAITVVGTIAAEGVTSEYGAASYTMTDAILIPYALEETSQ